MISVGLFSGEFTSSRIYNRMLTKHSFFLGLHLAQKRKSPIKSNVHKQKAINEKMK